MEAPPVAVCPAKQVRPSLETVALKRMMVRTAIVVIYCRGVSGRRAALRRSHYDHCSIRPQALFCVAPQAVLVALPVLLDNLLIIFNPETEKGTE